MTPHNFEWPALPRGLLRQLARDLGLSGTNPAVSLAQHVGRRPDEAFVGNAWPSLRERWIAKDPAVRSSIVAALRKRGLGAALSGAGTQAEIAYLRSCRNSASLRAVILEHLLVLGEKDSAPRKPALLVGRGSKAPIRIHHSEAWPEFEKQLALTLAQMEADQFLIVNARDTTNHYVQFAQQHPFGVRAETASNAFLEKWEQLDEAAQARLIELGWHPPTTVPPAPEDAEGSPNYYREWPLPVSYHSVAALAVSTLVDVLEIPHPGWLSYHAGARGGAEVILPNLGIARQRVDVEAPRNSQAPPVSREGLRAGVLEAMKVVLGVDEVKSDQDGDIRVQTESAMVFVRVVPDAPIVAVFAPVIWGIGIPADIEETMNQINSRIRFARAIWDGTSVIIASEVVGIPLARDQLGTSFRVVAALANKYTKKLQGRYGGSVAFGSALPIKDAPIGFRPPSKAGG